MTREQRKCHDARCRRWVEQDKQMAALERTVSLLLDCMLEARNNAVRSEHEFLIKNLRGCFTLSGRIFRRRQRVLRAFEMEHP